MSESNKNPELQELKALKKHRENKGVTVQTVADGMKVSQDFVRYIESGKFEKLGAPTFLRGHVTNYCKVMGLEPSAVLSLVPAQFLQHQDLKTSDAMGASPLARVKRQSNHLGRYAVGTALLGMLTLSFYFIWDKWSQPQRSLADNSLNVAQNEAENSGEKKITYSSLIPQVSNNPPVSLNTTEDEAVPVEENEVEATDVVEQLDDTPNNEGDQQDLSDGMNQTVAINTTPNGAANGYSIKLQLEEQAWVSIKTLDGDEIIQDLIGPGLREFQSDEPVHFRIGNAKKIQLLINDDPVELSQVIKQDIADFKWPLNPS